MPENDQSDIDKLRAEFDAKYKAFEDAHRDQFKAALRSFASACWQHPVTHLVTAGIGAAAVKFWPVVAKWIA